MKNWMIGGLVIVGLVIVAFLVAAALFPDFRVASRDIAIIIMAVAQIVATILLIVILLAVLYAVRAINRLSRETIVPKLDEVLEMTKSVTARASETAQKASTTTTFVAERVASPLIRASGVFAGVRAAAIVLARRSVASSNSEGNGTGVPEQRTV